MVLAGPLTRHCPNRPVSWVRVPDATRGHKTIDKPKRLWNSAYLNGLNIEGKGGGGKVCTCYLIQKTWGRVALGGNHDGAATPMPSSTSVVGHGTHKSMAEHPGRAITYAYFSHQHYKPSQPTM